MSELFVSYLIYKILHEISVCFLFLRHAQYTPFAVILRIYYKMLYFKECVLLISQKAIRH